jgi:hypothetical protein
MEQTRVPEMKPHKYGHVIFDSGAKTIQRGKTVFATNNILVHKNEVGAILNAICKN